MKEGRFLFSVCWKTSNHAPRALPRLKFLSISMRMESKMCLPRAEALEEPMPSPSLMTAEVCQKRTSIAWWLRKDCFEKQLRSYGYSVKQAASPCHSQAIETALKRPEARALEHFLFLFEKFTSSWESEALSVVERRHHSSTITI